MILFLRDCEQYLRGCKEISVFQVFSGRRYNWKPLRTWEILSGIKYCALLAWECSNINKVGVDIYSRRKYGSGPQGILQSVLAILSAMK